MIINDLLDMLNKEKRKQGRIKTAQKLAAAIGVVAVIGAGVIAGILCNTKSGKEVREKMMNKVINTAEDIKDTVIQKAHTAKSSVAHIEKEVSSTIKNINEKADDVMTDYKDGQQKIVKDINKAVDNISKDIKAE